jgi:dimethylhistidine N-methyltransferase
MLKKANTGKQHPADYVQRDDFYHAVIEGLGEHPRTISPKYFYDQQGSHLFESICEQPEYYLTRIETALLEHYADEIAALTGTGCYLVEPGSGSCEKARLLFAALRPVAYVPMDISCDHLNLAAASVAEDFPWLDVRALCMDITDSVDLSCIPADAKTVIFYPGSSIGNFDPDDAVEFLRCLAGITGPGGGLLIGVDLQKTPDILNAAYNDVQGVTAAFNKNILHRINRELDGDFDVSAFTHHAFYNSVKERVEMHLISSYKQMARVDGHSFEFNAGDSIHTESSYKYTTAQFHALARKAGLTPCATWTDSRSLFSLHYLRAI